MGSPPRIHCHTITPSELCLVEHACCPWGHLISGEYPGDHGPLLLSPFQVPIHSRPITIHLTKLGRIMTKTSLVGQGSGHYRLKNLNKLQLFDEDTNLLSWLLWHTVTVVIVGDWFFICCILKSELDIQISCMSGSAERSVIPSGFVYV